MVLLVDDTQWKLVRSDSIAVREFRHSGLMNLINLATVRKRAQSLKSANVVTIESSGDILYVHQNEMAMVKYGADTRSTSSGCRINPPIPRFVGTSEMTSCHAVLITSSAGFVFGHLDGSCDGRLTEDFFEKANRFFDDNPSTKLDECPQVHVVGGFVDSNDLSKVLTLQILMELLVSRLTFSLNTLCSYILNDHVTMRSKKQLHTPVVRGVVFDTHLASLFPAFILPKATGPVSVLRSSYSWSTSARCGMHNIFDPISHFLVLKPFVFDEKTLKLASYIKKLPREHLQHFSTTPKQETDNFYKMLRHTIRLLNSIAIEGVDFFFGKNLTFAFDENSKCWYPMDSFAECALKHPLTCLE